MEITLSSLLANVDRFKELTGKTCRAYICGPTAYESLKSNASIPEEVDTLQLAGVRIYYSPFVPDDGKFYPADYLEDMSLSPVPPAPATPME